MQYQDVLNFWFDEITPEHWWQKDEEFDQQIRRRFLAAHTAATRCELFEWRKHPSGRLAEIIVLDQFSRNIFRDSPAAFASDAQALTLAQEAVAASADKSLTAVERSFLYLPYMHSESLAIHELAVNLYRENGIAENLDYEIKHKVIIEKFGRYPHRNNILGRQSTSEEREFLKQPDSGF